jgi:hypothetical protein
MDVGKVQEHNVQFAQRRYCGSFLRGVVFRARACIRQSVGVEAAVTRVDAGSSVWSGDDGLYNVERRRFVWIAWPRHVTFSSTATIQVFSQRGGDID